MTTQNYVSYRDRLVGAVSEVIVGKEQEIELIAICYLCGGHILLEDVPGTGKTMLFRAFAKACGGSFKRIQFTPDVMPSDVTGINFYNMKAGEFEFRPGPVFADMVLADEINRATPRTQSSLLEAMAEGQVSVDGVTRALNRTFMVAATQNPIESYGTFPLPEAQMDRFMMRLKLGYMTREEEIGVALRKDTNDLIQALSQVVAEEETLRLRAELDEIEISEPVMGYLMDIVEKTRNDDRFNIGASPRGTIALCKTSRAYAAFRGRAFVTPDDVKTLAPHVLAHRLYYRTAVGSAEADALFRDMLKDIPVPTEE
ncbi:MAG: MoxR family ATPase [Clostridia bacterium]|jgi:MoxR-like ATPase|nr:MoxR family ATPase [Clostridia bacterium]